MQILPPPFLSIFTPMKTIDRTVAPPLRAIEKITLPKTDRLHLSNGIPVWSLNAGTQDVIKIELLFNAGRWQEPQHAVAGTANKMLLEGTRNKSSQQITEAVEFFGASFHTDAGIDYATVSLFTLTRHLPSLLPLLHEVISEASFPEKELNTYVQNSKQRLMVNLQKVDFLAHKEFNERLYGFNHPNGYTTSEKDYDLINVEILQRFYQAKYQQGEFKIILAGKVTDSTLTLLDEFLGKERRTYTNGSDLHHVVQTEGDHAFFTEKKDAVQSAIRIGKFIVNKLHPDFPKLRVLNTLLGGYFGSRLMQNLREEKGYCYGVHSGIASYVHDASFFISTEVGKEVTSDALKEIYKEVARLREEAIPEEELQLVKNYLLGVMLADADGPFNAAEVLRGLILYGMDENDFSKAVEEIRTVTSEELSNLALKYLKPDEMIEVVAGAK
jgi:zinc protease